MERLIMIYGLRLLLGFFLVNLVGCASLKPDEMAVAPNVVPVDEKMTYAFYKKGSRKDGFLGFGEGELHKEFAEIPPNGFGLFYLGKDLMVFNGYRPPRHENNYFFQSYKSPFVKKFIEVAKSRGNKVAQFKSDVNRFFISRDDIGGFVPKYLQHALDVDVKYGRPRWYPHTLMQGLLVEIAPSGRAVSALLRGWGTGHYGRHQLVHILMGNRVDSYNRMLLPNKYPFKNYLKRNFVQFLE